jgi:hypothetical protein
VFSVSPQDTTVEELFGEVFSVGLNDAIIEGLLGEIFSMWSIPRCYKGITIISRLVLPSVQQL